MRSSEVRTSFSNCVQTVGDYRTAGQNASSRQGLIYTATDYQLSLI